MSDIGPEVKRLQRFLDIAIKASGEGDNYLVAAAVLQVGADIENRLIDIEAQLQKIWSEMNTRPPTMYD